MLTLNYIKNAVTLATRVVSINISVLDPAQPITTPPNPPSGYAVVDSDELEAGLVLEIAESLENA